MRSRLERLISDARRRLCATIIGPCRETQGAVVPEIFASLSPELVAVSLPTWVDLASVVVGSATGIAVARQRHLDAVGFVGLALLCGLGGGLIRDIMMQRGGVYMLDSAFAIPASAATGIVAFLFPRPLDRAGKLLEWLDITAVALFALVGTDKALVNGLLPASCLMFERVQLLLPACANRLDSRPAAPNFS